MLTQEGQEAAQECLVRSGLADRIENSVDGKDSDLEFAHPDSTGEVTLRTVSLSRLEKSTDIPSETLEKV